MINHSDEALNAPQDRINGSRAGVPQSSDLSPVELSQIYALIDSILPFEACLYYQVLPLRIDGSRLVMGTVNPDDPAAVEYVTKQLSYINYSIRFQEISSDWHRDLLSKYLNYTAQKRQQTERRQLANPENETRDVPRSRRSDRSKSVLSQQKTFIIDQPDELADEVTSAKKATPPTNESVVKAPPSETRSVPSAQDLPSEQTPASVSSQEPRASASVQTPARSGTAQSTAADRAQSPLELHIDPHYRDVSSAVLASLPPQPLTQALLGKILDEGIGRLYFERRSQSGRILWSRDGILQAVVDSIDNQVLQGVINELKRMTHLSLISVDKPKQVEIERSYEGERILIRFRVMPGAFGEEGTVQILRGMALRFYQQQQIERLGRDVLDAAQVLQQRLDEMRKRARNSLSTRPTRSEVLPTLMKLLKHLEAQVKEIEASYDEDDGASSETD